MLPSNAQETPWWAWVVAIVVIFISALIVPDDVAFQHDQTVLQDER